MSSKDDYEVVIVGAGLIGSSAAKYAATNHKTHQFSDSPTVASQQQL